MKKIRLLAVDDEEIIGYLFQRIGANLGIQVDWVTSGEKALQMMQKKHYDVILSDYRLPEMNGESFYNEIHDRDPHMLRRLIFVTGDSLNSRMIHFFKNKHIPYLTKPFDLELLQALIAKMTRYQNA